MQHDTQFRSQFLFLATHVVTLISLLKSVRLENPDRAGRAFSKLPYSRTARDLVTNRSMGSVQPLLLSRAPPAATASAYFYLRTGQADLSIREQSFAVNRMPVCQIDTFRYFENARLPLEGASANGRAGAARPFRSVQRNRASRSTDHLH